MNIENLFKKMGFEFQTIIFECKYPVLFTCTKNDDVYLFVCPVYNADRIEWLGAKTSYENLIELLNDKITIRNIFIDSKCPLIIEYTGELEEKEICIENIPEYMLPDEGEYMEVEENEYEEEIAFFESKINESRVYDKYSSFLVLDSSSKFYKLFEEYNRTNFDVGMIINFSNLPKKQKRYKKIAVMDNERIEKLSFKQFLLVKNLSY